MTVGRALRLGLATGLVVAAIARGGEGPAGSSPPAEVRVMSLPGRPTVVTVQAMPDAQIDDHTAGAHPPAGGQGAASVGETFSDEITFVVHGTPPARQAAIDVADALVSTVRLFPDRAGTQVVVFVRQPVTYSIDRPTATGAIAITLRPRVVVTAAPAQPGQRHPPRAKPAEGEDQVAVDAAELSYDQQANVLIARGGVTLTRGATTLRADEVRYDRTNSVAEAHGHVVIVDPDATVEGDAANLDLDDETGWIDDVQADMKQSPYRLTAGHVEKHGGPCYEVKDGVFTTCRCGGIERPSWSIKGSHTEVTLGGVGIAKDATFRIGDVPVFYLPYLLFPANNDRQSGVLMPRLSYSNKRGFVYEQPFYWAIDKSSDLTLTTDVETSARIGLIGEYRYALSKKSRGTFTAGYFDESLGGKSQTVTPITTEPITIPNDRWIVAGRHRTLFGDGGQLYLDVLRLSDENFLRDIRSFASTVSGDIQIRSTRFTRSRLGLLQTWEGGAVQVEATSYQDLVNPQRFALDKLPRIAAEQSVPLLGGLAVARVPGEAVDFQRAAGFGGLRFDLAPELFVPFNLSRYVFGSVRGQVRETAYHLTNTDQVALVVPNDPSIGTAFRLKPGVLPDIAADHTRELAKVEGRIGTEVARVYSFPFLGLDRIRHSIEPEVQYLLVPQVGRDIVEQKLQPCSSAANPRPGRRCGATLFAEPYLFDEVDAINRRNFVSYGVTSRILGRLGGPTAAPAAVVAPPAPDATPSPDALDDDDIFDDEDDDQEAIDTIDPDTIPQGLPAAAIPPFAGAHGKHPGAPVVTGASRELLRVSLLQGYDISRELAGRSHLSDIDGHVQVTPLDWLGLSYNTTFDVQGGKTLARSVGVVVREPWWSPPPGRPSFQSASSIGLAYRFVASGLNSDLPVGSAEQRLFSNGAVENISGSLYLRAGDYLGFGFLGLYQLTPSMVTENGAVKTLGPRFVERDYFVRLTSPCACWAVELGVSDRADAGTTVRVQVLLYGLGQFGQGQGRRNMAGLAGLQNLGLRRPSALGRDY